MSETYEVKGVRIHSDGRREDCTIILRDGQFESSFTVDEKLKELLVAFSPDVVSIAVEFKQDHTGDNAAFFEVTISDEIAADLSAVTGKHERFYTLNRKLMDGFYSLDLGGRFQYLYYRSVSESRRAA
jgi:hypothetical protein